MSVALKPEGLRMEKGLLKSLTQTISFLRREIVLASFIIIFLLECASNTFKSKSDHPSGRSTDQNPVLTTPRPLFVSVSCEFLYYLKSKNYTHFSLFCINFCPM